MKDSPLGELREMGSCNTSPAAWVILGGSEGGHFYLFAFMDLICHKLFVKIIGFRCRLWSGIGGLAPGQKIPGVIRHVLRLPVGSLDQTHLTRTCGNKCLLSEYLIVVY